MAENKKSIVVVGDVCIDWFAVPVPRKQDSEIGPGSKTENWELRDGFRMYARPGGAWLLADLVANAVKHKVHHQEVPDLLKDKGCEVALHSLLELDRFPRELTGNEKRDKADLVWRVSAVRGFAGPGSDEARQCVLKTGHDPSSAGMIVLDDVGNGFRLRKRDWPHAIRVGRPGPLVLWKLSRPFGPSPLAKALEPHASNTVVLIDAEDLRAAGAAISRGTSWERTFHELIRSLRHDEEFKVLRNVKHLIVRLDMEAVVHLTDLHAFRSPGPGPSASVYFLPRGTEGSVRAQHPGHMVGCASVFTAALVARLAGPANTTLVQRIRNGVLEGMQDTIQFFILGLEADKARPVEYTVSTVALKRAEGMGIVHRDVSSLIGEAEDSRLFNYVRKGSIEKVACDIVARGIAQTIPDAPSACFGDFETLDRAEVETYRAASGLMRGYLRDPKPKRPLCMAVFGPPGSGKSFGVTEIAKSLADVEPLEFNMAQFTDPTQLAGAFHLIRDAVVRGKVPLAFFDEFDATVGVQELAWLKYLLAPMQDGKFSDGGSVHLIGKAIFVFAGGTKHSYKDFIATDPKDPEKFVRMKGPDFVSRLRGVIDVLGTEWRHANDEMTLVRRAVLLRSFLGRKAKRIFEPGGQLRIDPGVLRAFLRCPKYLHGARSMEAILDMCDLAGRDRFERACLPSRDQLALHTVADRFLALTSLDPLLIDKLEGIARSIHKRYCAKQRGKKPKGHPSIAPWSALKPHYREENHRQAEDIPKKLAMVGYAYRVAGRNDDPLVSFTDDEVALLAPEEHERWCDSLRMRGMEYATGEQTATTHPALLPWIDIPESERFKDEDAVRVIPELMKEAGFHVFKI